MTFKPSIWYPIAVVLTVLNLIAVGFAARPAEPWHATIHAALALAFGLWARRLRPGPGESGLHELQLQVEEYAAALEDTQNTLTNQAAQLAELHERVDFAERLLAQARDRIPLGGGQQPR